MLDKTEESRHDMKALQWNKTMWYDYLWTLSGALWFNNVPDVWGCVSRRPVVYCWVWLLSSRLCTGLILTLALFLCYPATKHHPRSSWQVSSGLIQWWRDLLTYHINYRPECDGWGKVQSHLQSCKACVLCECSHIVWVQCRCVDGVLHPWVIYIMWRHNFGYSHPRATQSTLDTVRVRGISQSRFGYYTYCIKPNKKTRSRWTYNVFWSLYTAGLLWPPHTERHDQETLIRQVSVWQMKQGNNSAMNSEHIIKELYYSNGDISFIRKWKNKLLKFYNSLNVVAFFIMHNYSIRVTIIFQ